MIMVGDRQMGLKVTFCLPLIKKTKHISLFISYYMILGLLNWHKFWILSGASELI